MITVAILINGQPLYTRSARNTGYVTRDGKHIYEVDNGKQIYHIRDEGAVALAHMLLDTIHEV